MILMIVLDERLTAYFLVVPTELMLPVSNVNNHWWLDVLLLQALSPITEQRLPDRSNSTGALTDGVPGKSV